jgi:hypothetical protein
MSTMAMTFAAVPSLYPQRTGNLTISIPSPGDFPEQGTCHFPRRFHATTNFEHLDTFSPTDRRQLSSAASSNPSSTFGPTPTAPT